MRNHKALIGFKRQDMEREIQENAVEGSRLKKKQVKETRKEKLRKKKAATYIHKETMHIRSKRRKRQCEKET